MSEQDIPLSRPDISDLEVEMVALTLRSGRLALGPMVEGFERHVADRAGCAHGVAVSSGTAGLHLALQALGVGPGDEVVTTPFSFIASANAILYVGARPVFVDIDPCSLNMDPARVAEAVGPRTRAILAVEAFGNPKHMDAYASIAARHEIPLVEDCCEALGCSHKGRACGSFGRVGVFGFYPNKQITTGEGGMIVTDDERLANVCRSLRNQGRAARGAQTPGDPQAALGTWLAHERVGYNYRLDELSAALGVAQMRRFDEIVARRQAVAQMYMERLIDHPELILPTVDPESVQSWFVFVVRLATGWARAERDRIIASLRRHEVGAADYFPCIHLQPPYRERFGFEEGSFPIAEAVSGRTIALPFHSGLSERDVDFVCQTLALMMSREGLGRG